MSHGVRSMKVRLKSRYAVLIPTKSRPDVLMKTLERQPFLNRPSTFIALELEQWAIYREVRNRFSQIVWSAFKNPQSSGCVAREHLRKLATSIGFQRYIPTDDNARYTEESLDNLVRASFVYPRQPVIVSGFHGTARHFDASKIKKAKVYHGLHFYQKWGAIFWCVPHSVYSRMEYPLDGGRMDDRFVSFAGLRLGCLEWQVCMEAPFTKATGKAGGYSTSGRTRLMGQSIVRLAELYPEYLDDKSVRISFSWAKILEKARKADGRSQEGIRWVQSRKD